MGRLTKARIDEIARLRGENYTQKEIAEKLGVHIRTVRKYDPLRERKPAGPIAAQLKEIKEACSGLIAQGLVDEESDGRICLSPLGRRVHVKFEELEREAILEFMRRAGRPVGEEEIQRYVDEIYDELFDKALNEAKKAMGLLKLH